MLLSSSKTTLSKPAEPVEPARPEPGSSRRQLKTMNSKPASRGTGRTRLELSAPCSIILLVPQGDLCRLAEQKRAAAEEMRRIARTLWFCTDRSRVMRRADQLEAESRWLLLDAATAVAALLAQPTPHQQQQAPRDREKGKS